MRVSLLYIILKYIHYLILAVTICLLCSCYRCCNKIFCTLLGVYESVLWLLPHISKTSCITLFIITFFLISSMPCVRELITGFANCSSTPFLPPFSNFVMHYVYVSQHSTSIVHLSPSVLSSDCKICLDGVVDERCYKLTSYNFNFLFSLITSVF